LWQVIVPLFPVVEHPLMIAKPPMTVTGKFTANFRVKYWLPRDVPIPVAFTTKSAI
jgi:hypothetical protein